MFIPLHIKPYAIKSCLRPDRTDICYQSVLDFLLSHFIHLGQKMCKKSFLSIALILALAPHHAFANEPDTPKDSPPIKGLLTKADQIAKEVSDLRQLPLKDPLQRDVRDREQLRDFLIKAMHEDYTPDYIQAEADTLKQLGLVPKDLDYEALIVDLLTSQIAGFYDPKVKQLYIMTGLPNAIQAPTMAHEIFHALQDQHYDLLSLQGPFKPQHQGDFSIARSSLFEGDATMLMLDYTLYQQGVLPKPATDSAAAVTTMAQMPMFTQSMKSFSLNNLMAMESLMGDSSPDEFTDSPVNKAPPIIKESLLFPYLAGLRFTLLAYEQLGSWDAFYTTLYASAPVSTEQILHPERYFAKDMPVLLDFDADKALPSYTRIYDNVMGEFQLHVALRHHLRLQRPKGAPFEDVNVDQAVEGWGGDRLVSYKNADNHVITVHLSSWDSEKDAQEYYQAQAGAQKTRYHQRTSSTQAVQAGSGQATYMIVSEGERTSLLYLEQWGDTVLHIEGLPAPKTEDLSHTYAPLKSLRDGTYHSLSRQNFQEEMKRVQELKDQHTPEPSNAP